MIDGSRVANNLITVVVLGGFGYVLYMKIVKGSNVLANLKGKIGGKKEMTFEEKVNFLKRGKI